MSRATKLFKTEKHYGVKEKPNTVNREGMPAWDHTIEDKYVQMLLTNTFGNTFYTTQEKLLEEAVELHDKVMTKDSEFAAKALVYARNEGYMRTQPIYGLVKLSSVNTQAFEQVFDKVIKTPDDLFDFYAILSSLGRGEGGRCVKRTVANWLNNNLSEYWAIKYGAIKSEGYSLKDVIRTSHPRISDEKKELFAYLLDKEFNTEAMPKIGAFINLKNATTSKQKAEAITAGRLPHEVVTGFIGDDQELWNKLVPNMPIMALMKSLATLERHNVADKNRARIQKVFGDKELIAKSKILPFRFLKASEKVNSMWLKDSLRNALELSFDNIEDIPGRTAVLLDTSGSMTDTMQKTAIFTIAKIFAIALMKKTNGNGRLIAYSNSANDYEVSMYDSILTQASKFYAGGGTNIASAIDLLTNSNDKVDNIVIITDEQENYFSGYASSYWGNSGRGAYDALNDYRKNVNSNVNTFVVDVQPESGRITPKDPKVNYIYGWSDKVLKFISVTSRGWGNMVEAIKQGTV